LTALTLPKPPLDVRRPTFLRTHKMVLKGEVADIGLAELFNALSVASRTGGGGTLVVASEDRKIHIYFGPEGIRLLREGGVSHTALGRLLLLSGRVSAGQLEEALENQKKSGGLLGRSLVELGYVTEEDIDECVKTQIEEEISTIFSWEDAHFEYLIGPPAAPFVDTSLLGKEIPLRASELLIKAARRVDEWSRLLDEAQKERAAFEIARRDAPPPDPPPFGFSYQDVKGIVQLLERVRRVDEIVGRAPLSRLEVARVLAFLLRNGYIRRVEKGEEEPAHETGDRWREEFSPETAEEAVRDRVESIWRSSRSREKALENMIAFADSLASEGRTDDAGAVYRVVLDLQPENAAVRTKLIHLYVVRWRFADAARVLVEGYRRQMRPPRE